MNRSTQPPPVPIGSSKVDRQHVGWPVACASRRVRVGRSVRVGLGCAVSVLMVFALVHTPSGGSVVAADPTASPAVASPVQDTSRQGPAVVTTRVDRGGVQIAEGLRLTISVQVPRGVRVSFPAASEVLGEFTVIHVTDAPDLPVGDQRQSTRVYELECYASGEQTIPSLEISMVDSRDHSAPPLRLKSHPLKITVASSLEGQTDPSEFRDLKGVVPFQRPASMRRVTLGIVSVAVGAVVGMTLAVLIRRKRQSSLDARAWAINEMNILQNEVQQQRIEQSDALQQLSNVLRIYLEGEYHLDAPRWTTAELLDRVCRYPGVDPEHVAVMEQLFTRADLIKFGGSVPGPFEFADAVSRARALVAECVISPSEEAL